MSDLINRLRGSTWVMSCYSKQDQLYAAMREAMREAADALEAQARRIAALERDNSKFEASCAEDGKRIAELEARLAQVEGDAGRYRWLRKGSPKSNRLPHITQYQYQAKIDENKIPQVWDIEGYHPDRLDAAIDAAMKEQTNG